MEKKDIDLVEEDQEEKFRKRNEALFQLLDFRNNLTVPLDMVLMGEPDNEDEDEECWESLMNRPLKTPVELYSETRWGNSWDGTPWPQLLLEHTPFEIEAINEYVRKLNQAVLDRDISAYEEIAKKATDYIGSFFS